MNNSIIPREKLFLVTDIPGYTPNVSRLICMMNYVRQVTLGSVKGLTIDELDYLHDDNSNSIGALLFHIASIEFYYQKLSFEGQEWSEEEFKEWEPAFSLGALAREKIKGNNLDFYLNVLNDIRNRTYELFKDKDDDWLDEKFLIYNKFNSNYYHAWFHVFEDEINHRGQINFLKKRMKK